VEIQGKKMKAFILKIASNTERGNIRKISEVFCVVTEPETENCT
jgi:hypothetical protein